MTWPAAACCSFPSTERRWPGAQRQEDLDGRPGGREARPADRQARSVRPPALGSQLHWQRPVPRLRLDHLRRPARTQDGRAPAALVFVDNDGTSSSGFSDTMELADRRQDRYDASRPVWDFLSSVPFYRMTPRQDLVDSGFCLAEVGKQYLVYLETRGLVNVRVTQGKYDIEWINAQNLTDRRPSGTTQTGEKLTSPKDGADWLLRLTAVASPGPPASADPTGLYFLPPGEARPPGPAQAGRSGLVAGGPRPAPSASTKG